MQGSHFAWSSEHRAPLFLGPAGIVGLLLRAAFQNEATSQTLNLSQTCKQSSFFFFFLFHSSFLHGCSQTNAMPNQKATSSTSLALGSSASATLILFPPCCDSGHQLWCCLRRSSKTSKLLNLVLSILAPFLLFFFPFYHRMLSDSRTAWFLHHLLPIRRDLLSCPVCPLFSLVLPLHPICFVATYTYHC